MPDYKTPPKPEPVKKSTIAIICGAILILALGYLIWTGKISFRKSGQQQASEADIVKEQKQMQKEQLDTMLVQSGYPKTLPQDFVLNPTIDATTTVTTVKSTGKATTKVQFTVDQQVMPTALMYGSGLKAKGWTISPPAGKGGQQQISFSKDSLKGTMTFAPAKDNKGKINPMRTTVTVSY